MQAEISGDAFGITMGNNEACFFFILLGRKQWQCSIDNMECMRVVLYFRLYFHLYNSSQFISVVCTWRDGEISQAIHRSVYYLCPLCSVYNGKSINYQYKLIPHASPNVAAPAIALELSQSNVLPNKPSSF